ncbi:MAG: ketosteroid isomerase [Cytophagales bacterium]|nr:MAG: ketosteroid isomerase [Cytophagales bacterium]
MTNENNVKTIETLYAAFAVGDVPTVLAGLDEKVVWNEAEGNMYADGNPYIGPQAILNGVFARIGADYEYFNLVNIELHEMYNSQVLATLRYQAKLKNNGATYDAQVAHLWTLENEKAIGFQQYLDTKKVADAIAQ